MEKNSQLSQELDECKAQLEAPVAALKESKKGPPGNFFVYCKEYRYQVVCGMHAHLTIDVAGGLGVNPEAVAVHTGTEMLARACLRESGRRKMISKMPISGWAWN